MDLQTSDDHFNYGVERLKARDMEVARRHLDRALAMEPNGEHILFTLALCCGLAGDGAAACENLKRAIALEPRNKVLARQGSRVSGSLAQQLPALRALLAADNSDGLLAAATRVEAELGVGKMTLGRANLSISGRE